MEQPQTSNMVKQEELYVPEFEKPIPGQSLTNDPDNPAPFEGPPEITSLSDGLNELFLMMTDEAIYPGLMESIRDGVPLSEIAQLTLFEGFANGKWNPDMVLLLFEPLMYMLMALSEKVQIQYVLYPGEDKDEEVLKQSENVELLRELTEIASQEIGRTGSRTTSLPPEIQERLEEFEATAPEEENVSELKGPSLPAKSLLSSSSLMEKTI